MNSTRAESAVIEQYKQQAAERALEFVSSGMIVGLGTGSTAIYATRRLGRLLRDGLLHHIVGVPTSAATAVAAEQLRIPLLANDLVREIDITIDGADEVSPELDLIKGGGGAMLREKIVARASHRLIIVVDDSKLSPTPGARRAVPVEVVRFGWRRAGRAGIRRSGSAPTRGDCSSIWKRPPRMSASGRAAKARS